MDNLLKNLKQTQEAQQLISLMGEQGSDEYFKQLLDTTGNFDDAVMKLGLDTQTIPLQKQAGITPDYKQLIKVIPKGMAEVRAIKNAPLPQKAALTQQIVQSAVQSKPQTANVGYNQSYQPITVNQPESFNQIQSRSIAQARTPNLGVTSQRFTPSSTSSAQFIQPQAQFSTNAPQASQQISTQIQSIPVQGPNTPNVVSPFNTSNLSRTQQMGETYSHPYGNAEDYAIYGNPQVNSQIGGRLITGTAPGQGYGKWTVMVGANPKENQQMSPQEFQSLSKNVTDLINRGGSLNELGPTGRDLTLNAHGENILGNTGDYIGTGSALLTQGGSGGWNPHLHTQTVNRQGIGQGVNEFAKSYGIDLPSITNWDGSKGGGKQSNKMISPFETYMSQVNENKKNPFFNDKGNNPIQWAEKVAQEFKQRGLAEGLHGLVNPVLMNPYIEPIAEPLISKARVFNYESGMNNDLINSLLGQKRKTGGGKSVSGILPLQQTMNQVGQAFQNIARPVQQMIAPVAKQISSTINYASNYKPQSVAAPKPTPTPQQPSSQINYTSSYKPQTVQAPQAYGQQSYGSGQQSSQQSKPNTYVSSSSGYQTPSTSSYTPTQTTSTMGFQSYFAPTPVQSYSNPWSSPTQSYAKASSPVQSQPQSNFFSSVVNQVKSWASNFGKRSSW